VDSNISSGAKPPDPLSTGRGKGGKGRGGKITGKKGKGEENRGEESRGWKGNKIGDPALSKE
jgi:hypothetical protein